MIDSQLKAQIFAIVSTAFLVISYQNCSQKLNFSNNAVNQYQKSNLENSFQLKEDEVLESKFKTYTEFDLLEKNPVVITVLSSPENGTFELLNHETGEFRYKPKANYFGTDQVQVIETLVNKPDQSFKKTLYFNIESVDDGLEVKDPVYHFDMNSPSKQITLNIVDSDNSKITTAFKDYPTSSIIKSQYGILTKIDNMNFTFTPAKDIRGTAIINLLLTEVDPRTNTKKIHEVKIELIIGNPFQNVNVSLAVRGAGCFMCHAKINSDFVTDFGGNDEWGWNNELKHSSNRWMDWAFYGDFQSIPTWSDFTGSGLDSSPVTGQIITGNYSLSNLKPKTISDCGFNGICTEYKDQFPFLLRHNPCYSENSATNNCSVETIKDNKSRYFNAGFKLNNYFKNTNAAKNRFLSSTVAEYLTRVEAEKSNRSVMSIFENLVPTFPVGVNYINGYQSIENYQPAKVSVAKELYIGAPTASDIGLSNNSYAYLKNDSSNGIELVGLVQRSDGHFEIQQSSQLRKIHPLTKIQVYESVLQCDGDLKLKGNILLKNLKLKTLNGCRLYVDGIVYIQGQILYEQLNSDLNQNANLQITSTEAIILGLKDFSSTNSGCDEQAYRRGYSSVGPLTARLVNWATYHERPTMKVRSYPEDAQGWDSSGKLIYGSKNINVLSNKIINGANNYNNYFDARCLGADQISKNGETDIHKLNFTEVSYEKLLLNAPIVQSGYKGSFKGIIIAEIALFSLDASKPFDFQFDPIFKTVPILPLIQMDKIFKVVF